MNNQNISFFRSVKKFSRIKMKTMVIIHENNPNLLYDMLDEYYTTQTSFKTFHRIQIL